MQTYNDQFEALVKEADVKSSSLDMSEKMRDLRVQMGDWYQDMVSLAFASNVLNESEESLSFLTGLNAVRREKAMIRAMAIWSSSRLNNIGFQSDADADTSWDRHGFHGKHGLK